MSTAVVVFAWISASLCNNRDVLDVCLTLSVCYSRFHNSEGLRLYWPCNLLKVVQTSLLKDSSPGFFCFQNHGLFRAKKHSHPLKFGAPERKILFTLCYYVFMTVFALTRFTIIVRNSGFVMSAITEHFLCQAQGRNPDCDRNAFRQYSFPYMSAISLALIAFFPAINLVYAVNVRELKDKCGCGAPRKRRLTTNKSTTSITVSSNM